MAGRPGSAPASSRRSPIRPGSSGTGRGAHPRPACTPSSPARPMGRASSRRRRSAAPCPMEPRGGVSLTAHHVAILPNSTQALLLTFAALRDHGVEHIVVAAPVYFSAVEVCRRLGLAVSVIPAADFVTGALDLDALARAMTRPRS